MTEVNDNEVNKVANFDGEYHAAENGTNGTELATTTAPYDSSDSLNDQQAATTPDVA